MTQPGYQAGSEPMWWWKVALHLDEAQLALTNAMAHNVDDPRPVIALHDRLREGQVILLEIFRAKGLLPGSTNGTAEASPTSPASPASMPPMPMPGMPMPGMPSTPAPMGAHGDVAAPVEQAPLAEVSTTGFSTTGLRWPAVVTASGEPAVPEVDQTTAASEPKQTAAPSPEAAATAVIAPPAPTTAPTTAPTVAPPTDPGAGGARE